jgi:hypothetical protein
MGMSYHDTEWSADESRPVALHECSRAEKIARMVEPLAIGIAVALLCLCTVGAVWLMEWLP